ncbi:hypothetical protein NMH04_08795 [Bacillus altitudinis]|uniref:hypothetical protein n=1 Tax=Bacillus altitudinis TaxID=293387 RepID=UPI001C23D535|nr:hypothetical protein [Bacillus altitudinis]MBU8968011.1 hypothetical protein [Bacillus altitudinis]UTX10530.1 hypothetical protein NMH04_08795 [Bacillus altitudinis]
MTTITSWNKRLKKVYTEVKEIEPLLTAAIKKYEDMYSRGLKKIMQANLKEIMVGVPKEEAVELLGPKLLDVFEWDDILPVEKYSKFNALVWAKRIQRELNQQDEAIRYYRNRLWKIHSLLEKLEGAYRKSNEKKKVRKVYELLHQVTYLIFLRPYRASDIASLIEMCFFTMTKNDFLSLLSIDHSKERAEEVKSHIDSIPAKVDFNTFCHFVHDWVLEDENNDDFFSILSRINVEAVSLRYDKYKLEQAKQKS